MLDGQPVTCSSIAALHVSATNPSTIYAGCGGSTSSEEGHDWNVMNSGDWAGLMVSTDRGETWKMTGFPPNRYITGVIDMGKGTVLASTQSELYDATAGGIWRSTDDGASWTQVSTQPTFTLMAVHGGVVLATHAHSGSESKSVSVSTDGGMTWQDVGGGSLDWGAGAVPFYTCATLLSDGDTVVLGGLTVLPSNSSVTNSALFTTSLKSALDGESTEGVAWKKLPQPMSMDQDSMPKVRLVPTWCVCVFACGVLNPL